MLELLVYVMDKVVVLCLYLTILNNIFGIRLSCKKKRWIAVVLLTLVGTVFVYGAQYYLNVDDIYGVTILAFAAPFFLVEERGKVKMGALFLAFFLISLFNDCANVIISYIGKTNLKKLIIRQNHFIEFEKDILLLLVFLLIGIFFQRKVKKLYYLINGRSYFVILITLFLINNCMGFVTIGLFAQEYSTSLMRMLVFVSFILGILILFVLGYMVYLMNIRLGQYQMIQTFEKEAKTRESYYNQLYEKNRELRRFRHDYHHHLNCIYAYVNKREYDQLELYLSNLINWEENLLNKQDCYSGNSVIDAVIYGVLSQTEDNNIEFEYRGKIAEKLKINSADLCIVLANALENAVEACCKCAERKIEMESRMYAGNLQIEIKNTYLVSEQDAYSLKKTSKKDKNNHGYGIQNMRRVVEKYNGELIQQVKEGKFITLIQMNELDINV